MITKIIDDILRQSSPYTDLSRSAIQPTRCISKIALGLSCCILSVTTSILALFNSEATKDCARFDSRCEELSASYFYGTATWRWTMWLSAYPWPTCFCIYISHHSILDRLQMKSRDVIFILLTNATSIVSIATRGSWFTLFYALRSHIWWWQYAYQVYLRYLHMHRDFQCAQYAQG
jgi:hypothetical protein